MTKPQLVEHCKALEAQLVELEAEGIELRDAMTDMPDDALTPHGLDIRRRNREIVTALFRGLSESQVANTYGIGERHVRRILKEWRDAHPGPRETGMGDPLALVDEALELYQGAAEELALIAATTEHGSTRVGAIRTRIDAITRRVALLQATGLLPHDLGKLRLDIDVRYVAEQIVSIFQDEGIPAEVTDRVITVLGGAASMN